MDAAAVAVVVLLETVWPSLSVAVKVYCCCAPTGAVVSSKLTAGRFHHVESTFVVNKGVVESARRNSYVSVRSSRSQLAGMVTFTRPGVSEVAVGTHLSPERRGRPSGPLEGWSRSGRVLRTVRC